MSLWHACTWRVQSHLDFCFQGQAVQIQREVSLGVKIIHGMVHFTDYSSLSRVVEHLQSISCQFCILAAIIWSDSDPDPQDPLDLHGSIGQIQF